MFEINEIRIETYAGKYFVLTLVCKPRCHFAFCSHICIRGSPNYNFDSRIAAVFSLAFAQLSLGFAQLPLHTVGHVRPRQALSFMIVSWLSWLGWVWLLLAAVSINPVKWVAT